MAGIWLAFLSAMETIFLKVVSQKFFEWLFFWSAEKLVKHTQTNVDDEFLAKAKELYKESK